MNVTQESAQIMFIFWRGDLDSAVGNYYRFLFLMKHGVIKR